MNYWHIKEMTSTLRFKESLGSIAWDKLRHYLQSNEVFLEYADGKLRNKKFPHQFYGFQTLIGTLKQISTGLYCDHVESSQQPRTILLYMYFELLAPELFF